jgi:hypothetical protein
VWAVDAELGAQCDQNVDERVQLVRELGRDRAGLAEPRQVEPDHVALGGELAEHRLPGLPVVPDPVHQQQRLTGAASFVRNLDTGYAVDRDRRGAHTSMI